MALHFSPRSKTACYLKKAQTFFLTFFASLKKKWARHNKPQAHFLKIKIAHPISNQSSSSNIKLLMYQTSNLAGEPLLNVVTIQGVVADQSLVKILGVDGNDLLTGHDKHLDQPFVRH